MSVLEKDLYIPNSVLFNKSVVASRQQKHPLEDVVVDYKDLAFLSKFISEKGRLLPKRFTGVSAQKQKAIARAVKLARILALLPFAK